MEVVCPGLAKILPSNKFLLNSQAIPTPTKSELQVQLPPRILKQSSKTPSPPARTPTATSKLISNNPSSSSSHTTSDILRLMDSLSLPIPPDIYASLIKECTITRHSRRALELHSHIKKSRSKLSLPLLNRLLLMHLLCGHLEIAHQLFDQMFLRDFNSWAIMIVACLHAGDFEEAIAYFVFMEYRNFLFKFPAWIIICLLKSCVLAKNMELGKQVHGQLLKLGISNDLSLSGSLINFYGNFRCLDDANFVFNQLSQRNTVTWTAKIVNSCREEQFDKVIDDFIEMGRQGIKKNSFTFSSVLKACAGMNDDGMSGRQVHANAIKLGLESDVFIHCGLINMYGKCRLVRDAEKAFEIVDDKRNIACWNAMIMGYVHNKFCVEAIKLLYGMKEAGIKVQESLINDVRIACARFEAEDDDDAVEEEPLDHHSIRSPPLTQSDSQPNPDPETQINPDPNPVPTSDPPPRSDLQKPSPTTFEDWDEDEFEGLPVEHPPPEPPKVAENATPNDPDPKTTSKPQNAMVSKKSFTVEIICGFFLIVFIINYFTGKRENENLALAWAAKFATKGSIFEKNFSLLGVGEGEDSPLLLKEGQTVFKFYASGRRYCQGLLATMELKSRHDLISRLFNLVVPCKDEITFEVYMNDEAMDQVVFAMAKKKAAKGMQKEIRDLQRFAGLVANPTGRKWVAEELSVISESKEVAGDLITEAVLEQVFGDKAFEKYGKDFISMHFSDQHPGTHRKILLFKFALPDANHMNDMTRLVALVPYYIDLIGRYKLSSQARSKTEAARVKAAQEAYKELQNARQEALQKKKAERKKMLEEAEAKLSAEAICKKEAKRQTKKGMPRMKMTRGH
ncbi:hypothetical protein REPUB_Repub01dG0258500 [Reevesia pubescens]